MPERRTVVPRTAWKYTGRSTLLLGGGGGGESQDVCGFGGTVAKQGAGTLRELAKDY